MTPIDSASPLARKPRTPLQRLWTMAWRAPLWAILSAIFFGTLFGSDLQSYALA